MIGRHAALRALAAGVFVLMGCGARAPLPLRPEPIPKADMVPVPEPKAREPLQTAKLIEVSLGRELVQPFNVQRWFGDSHQALNITHFDDVVNSAWFQHRNAARRMTPEAVARGPADRGGPDTSRTLTIIDGKSAGISPGFTVRDARGDVYLFKFDPPGHLHLGSAADVISSRLFYAAGYNTPADFIVVFDSARLRLDPGAEITTPDGERAMEADDVGGILARTGTLADGRYLALASRFLPGEPKGPFMFAGVRSDDPNDYYHHEFRRELRGLYVMSAWLNHVDMRFANTLDVYVEPGYLRHYLIDFAASLGSGTIRPHTPREGREYNFDLWPSLGRIVSLGFLRLGWEDRPFGVIHPSVGWLPVEGYDPGEWKPNWPNAAFTKMTVRDGYWGAKLVASFTDAQLRAVVAEARLPAAAADTMVDILSFRRDRTVKYWFGKVTPLENPRVMNGNGDGVVAGEGGPDPLVIGFADLGVDAGVWTAAVVGYQWEFEHTALARRASGTVRARPGARQRISVELGEIRPGDHTLSGRAAIATLEITAVRPNAETRPAVVYLRWEPGDRYSVVGLEH